MVSAVADNIMKSIGEDGKGWPKIFIPKNTSTHAVVGYPYPDRRVALPAFVAGGLFVYICIHYAVEWYWCLPGVFAFIFLTCSVSKSVVVDGAAQNVQIHFRFFMRWTLKLESFPLSEIEAIIYTVEEPGDDGRRKRVGLRCKSGQRFWLRGFGCDGTKEDSSRRAEEFAWRLSCDTGIPIQEKPVKTFF